MHSLEFRAQEVIVSCGAYRTPQLLMLSGIGPAATLRQHGIEVRADIPDVGRGLNDHLMMHLNWQLHPDPGSCVRAYGQLLAQGVSNIVIDLFLISISIPILRTQIRTFPHNLQLGAMFILGTFCVIVTCVRLYYTFENNSFQNSRTLWASIQALFAAFVANAASIYGVMMLRRRKSVTRSRLWYSPEAKSSESPLNCGKVEQAVTDEASY